MDRIGSIIFLVLIIPGVVHCYYYINFGYFFHYNPELADIVADEDETGSKTGIWVGVAKGNIVKVFPWADFNKDCALCWAVTSVLGKNIMDVEVATFWLGDNVKLIVAIAPLPEIVFCSAFGLRA